MNRKYLGAFMLALALMLMTGPACAFTAESLDIAVDRNGDAIIVFAYELTWAEEAAVFMRITDPSAELKKALESNYKKTVDVIGTDSGSSQFVVHEYASVKEHGGNVTMSTPALSFVSAEKVLKKYWFAPFINPDFSPSVTRVSFPDGHTEVFCEQISIPALRHTFMG